jgi:MSHA biogenesis protein MshE
VLHVQTEADSKIATALVLRLKLMSGLDISEKRLPQDGRFNIKLRNTAIDVRISTMPTQHGESVGHAFAGAEHRLAAAGTRCTCRRRILDRFRHSIARPSGIVLVTGPTGSGKTTTLYAALNELNTPEKKIITVEDPVEYRLPGSTRCRCTRKIDLSFSRVLRTALRQDPDIILVGEMRDQETAEIGMRAAMTGHLVLSTLHTNDALSTPIRLLDMGVPRYMVAMSIQMVLAQRLVRVICENCSAPHTPAPHEHCGSSRNSATRWTASSTSRARAAAIAPTPAIRGARPSMRYLDMSNALVEAVNRGDPNEFMQIGREQMAGNTLRRDAVRLVSKGRTTIEEAMRISTQLDE